MYNITFLTTGPHPAKDGFGERGAAHSWDLAILCGDAQCPGAQTLHQTPECHSHSSGFRCRGWRDTQHFHFHYTTPDDVQDQVPTPSTLSSTTPNEDRDQAPNPKKRKNEVVEYLKEYTVRQESRQRELDVKEEEKEKKKRSNLTGLSAYLEH